MIGANAFSVMEAGVILAGICFLAVIIGSFIYVGLREENGRPILPWGARMRVERAKAALELDAIEVKRLATESLRSSVLQGIEDGKPPAEVVALALQASSSPDSPRKPSY